MNNTTKILYRGLGILSIFTGIWGGAFGLHYCPGWMGDAVAGTATIFFVGGVALFMHSIMCDL